MFVFEERDCLYLSVITCITDHVLACSLTRHSFARARARSLRSFLSLHVFLPSACVCLSVRKQAREKARKVRESLSLSMDQGNGERTGAQSNLQISSSKARSPAAGSRNIGRVGGVENAKGGDSDDDLC